MIQRIQSIYLLLGALVLGSLLLFDEIWLGETAAMLPWFAPALLIGGGVVIVVALVAIFLYKNRTRQRGVVVVVQWLTVVWMGVFYGGLFYSGQLQAQAGGDPVAMSLLGLLVPIIAYIFFFLARRGIQKDIALVRSMDRLR